MSVESHNLITPSATRPGMVEKPFCPVDPEFLDTGTVVTVDVPYTSNYKYMSGMRGAGNLPMLFALRVGDRFVNQQTGGDQSIIVADKEFWLLNAGVSVHNTLNQPLNFLRAMSFRGWRGSFKYLFHVITNSVVQGSLSFIRTRNIPPLNMRTGLYDVNASEPDSNVIFNLASDRFAMVDVPYNESTDWVDEQLYSNARIFSNNVYTTNEYRSWIAVRPNSDLNTFNGSPSKLTFRIYIEFGQDFEWLYPTSPIRMNSLTYKSVIDYYDPFAYILRVVLVSYPTNLASFTVFYSGHSRDLYEIDDFGTTFNITPEVGVTRQPYWWDDKENHKFRQVSTFKIQKAAENIVVVADGSSLFTIPAARWHPGLVIFTIGSNNFADAPPYPITPVSTYNNYMSRLSLASS